MASISLFSTWAIGIMNGYKKYDTSNMQKEGLSKSIIYSTIGLSSGVNMFRVLGSIQPNIKPLHMVSSLFVGVPMLVATTFCLGSHVGRTLRETSKKE